MANPASMSDHPAVILTSTTEFSLILDPDREYTLYHDGETDAGVASALPIYLSFSAAVDNDESEGDDKAKLMSARTLVIGPGVPVLYVQLKAAAATTPTFTIVPGPKYLGKY